MSVLPPVLPPSDRALPSLDRVRLVTEILITYVRARRSLANDDIRSALETLRSTPSEATPPSVDPRQMGIRLGRVTARTLGPLPGDSRCLTQSLVLSRLLARRGIESTVVLAVRPGEKFAAHAWVEHEGRPLLEPASEGFGRLVEI